MAGLAEQAPYDVRRRAALAAYAAAASIAATAQANPLPGPTGVRYVQGAPPGLPRDAAGNAGYDAATNTVYYQGKLDRFARGHESGHAFDRQILDDGQRAYFQHLMGLPAGQWRTGTGLQGLKSPSEWFADYYSAAVNNVDPRYQSAAAYATVTPKRLKRFEAAMRRLDQREHLKPYQR